MIADMAPMIARRGHVQLALSSIVAGASLVHVPFRHSLQLAAALNAAPHLAGAVGQQSFVINVSKPDEVKNAMCTGYRRVACGCVSGDLQAMAGRGHRAGGRSYNECQQQVAAILAASVEDDAIRRGCACDVTVVMLSALACPLEGAFVPPSRVADNTKALLDLGAAHVVWEEGMPGLTCRAFENLIKTCAALGVDPSRLSVLLRSNAHVTTRLLQMAASAGVSIVGCSVDGSAGSTINKKHDDDEDDCSLRQVYGLGVVGGDSNSNVGSYVACDTALAALAEAYGELTPPTLLDDLESFHHLRHHHRDDQQR